MQRSQFVTSPGDEIYLTVVIPAFNEEKRISTTLHQIDSYLASQAYSYEIIVVDDGSQDKTAPFVARLCNNMASIRLIKNGRNRGKGFSVKRGVMSARGEHILFSDADLSTPIEEVEKFISWFQDGYEVVIGSRGLPDSNILIHQPFHRESMGLVFNLLVQMLLIKGRKDTQCGFKGFQRQAAENIFRHSTINGFGFDVEVLYLADKLGYKIREVPITWRNSKNSSVRLISSSMGMLIDLLKIKFRSKR